MAIAKRITFEGNTYSLGTIERVAAQTAVKETGVGSNYLENIVLLTDQAAATTIRAALTIADSGTHFIVPALTSGAQSITLPAVSAATLSIVPSLYRSPSCVTSFNIAILFLRKNY